MLELTSQYLELHDGIKCERVKTILGNALLEIRRMKLRAYLGRPVALHVMMPHAKCSMAM
jgi:hypothetical protein